MNAKQAQEYLGNANATKFAIDLGVVGSWNDVVNEISSLDHGDHDQFVITDGGLQGKTLDCCNGEFEII